MQTGLHAAGVWTPLARANPAGGCGTMMLLTDGTVIVQGPGVTKTWTKLTPDSSGNYINGTWSNIASMSLERLYFASNVLPNGKVFLIGGEYSGPNGFQNIINSGEIYDPVANTWSPIATIPAPFFGDDPSVVLPNGKVMCGYIFDGSTYLYDPVNNSWAPGPTKLRSEPSDETTWVLLPGGDVLSYDVFASPSTGPGYAQRYVATTGAWTNTGPVPVPLSGPAFGYELGPATLLPDGRVFQVGANNRTTLYKPQTNSWTQGPNLPATMGADDAPGAMLPNGRFLFAADTSSPAIFTPPTKLYDFDYATNKLTDVTPSALANALNVPAYVCRMLILPNGHMLFSTSGGTLYDYAPAGGPQASWAPTITNVAPSTSKIGVYTITGTQLTGISEGAGYGDDAEMSTNYPIVRLTNSTGAVQYLRSYNWTPGVATGSTLTTCQFTLPSSVPLGTYTLNVIANGIPSADYKFNLGVQSNVVAAFDSKTSTLTLTGDSLANSLTVSVQAGVLKVEGANGTTINKSASYTVNVTGPIIINAALHDGDDSLAVIGVDSSKSYLDLGPGNDKAALTLCNVKDLTVDGGPGIDVVTVTSSTVGSITKLNLP